METVGFFLAGIVVGAFVQAMIDRHFLDLAHRYFQEAESLRKDSVREMEDTKKLLDFMNAEMRRRGL